MPRDIHPDVLAAYERDVVRRAHLLYLDYPSGEVFVNDRTFPIWYSWDGGPPTLFHGVGDYGSMGRTQEVIERRVQRLSLGLSGVNKSLLAKHLSEDYMGRIGRVWELALDEDWQIIGEPVKLFAGKIANQSLRYGWRASIAVTLASVEEDWERVRERYYTDEDQQSEYPGDLGLEHVSDFAAGKPIKWGRA